MRLKGDFKITVERGDWKYIAIFILLIVRLVSDKTGLLHTFVTVIHQLK